MRTRYLQGNSAEDRDAWLLAIQNNLNVIREQRLRRQKASERYFPHSFRFFFFLTPRYSTVSGAAADVTLQADEERQHQALGLLSPAQHDVMISGRLSSHFS